jgi:hypothetical protein
MDALGYSASLIFDRCIPVSAFIALDVELDDSVEPGSSTRSKAWHLAEDLLR